PPSGRCQRALVRSSSAMTALLSSATAVTINGLVAPRPRSSTERVHERAGGRVRRAGGDPGGPKRERPGRLGRPDRAGPKDRTDCLRSSCPAVVTRRITPAGSGSLPAQRRTQRVQVLQHVAVGPQPPRLAVRHTLL